MRYFLLLFLLLSACIPDPENDNDSKIYYLKAYLFANSSVRYVQVKEISQYGYYTIDTTTEYSRVDKWISDAKVTLIHNNERIPLNIDRYEERNYESDHIVEEGGHYSIEAVIFDSLKNREITLTAETTVPYKDSTVSLSKDTLHLDSADTYNNFWQMYKEPQKYPHMKLSLKPSDKYQKLKFVPTGQAIFKMSKPQFKERKPMQASEMIISPVHFPGYRYYPEYTLVVFHMNEEYADIYVNNGPESDAWTTGNTDLVPEGISNVSNGGGIFTGVASDTLKFSLRAD